MVCRLCLYCWGHAALVYIGDLWHQNVSLFVSSRRYHGTAARHAWSVVCPYCFCWAHAALVYRRLTAPKCIIVSSGRYHGTAARHGLRSAVCLYRLLGARRLYRRLMAPKCIVVPVSFSGPKRLLSLVPCSLLFF